MTSAYAAEVAASLERAEQSIHAAQALADEGWYDFFEVRNVGDYGVTAHVSGQETEPAIRAAQGFLHAIMTLLQPTDASSGDPAQGV